MTDGRSSTGKLHEKRSKKCSCVFLVLLWMFVTLHCHEVGKVPDEFTNDVLLPFLIEDVVVLPQHDVLVLLREHHRWILVRATTLSLLHVLCCSTSRKFLEPLFRSPWLILDCRGHLSFFVLLFLISKLNWAKSDKFKWSQMSTKAQRKWSHTEMRQSRLSRRRTAVICSFILLF